MFIDRDSLVYEIRTQDLYKDFFDFSDYQQDLKFVDPTNNKVVFKIKYESDGKIKIIFFKLELRMYSLV